LVVLKTVLTSPAWTDGMTARWEDPAHTILIRSPVRRMVAEVAGRIHANVKLYAVGLTQESDTTEARVWYAVPMLEENAQ
jgi:hypothetical protein